MISASVFSGYVAANRLHSGPPSDTPSSTARSDPPPPSPRARRPAAARASAAALTGTGSDRPVPRLSNRISRAIEPSRVEEARERRLVPEVLEVRDPAHDEDEIDRARPDDLIGDVDAAAVRVADARRGRRRRARRRLDARAPAR